MHRLVTNTYAQNMCSPIPAYLRELETRASVCITTLSPHDYKGLGALGEVSNAVCRGDFHRCVLQAEKALNR